MKKDFDRWNKKKKKIHKNFESKFYGVRDIWWCSLGTNVGFEQDGTGVNYDRPVIILKGFNKQTCLTIALTGKKRTGEYYLYIGKIDDRDATINLSQIRLVDTKRLIKKIGVLEKDKFELLQKRLSEILLTENK